MASALGWFISLKLVDVSFIMNSFFLFCQDNRSALLQIGGSNSDVTSILGAMWRNLPSEEKARYKERASSLPKLRKPRNRPAFSNYTHKFKITKFPSFQIKEEQPSIPSSKQNDHQSASSLPKGAKRNILDIEYFRAAFADFKNNKVNTTTINNV